MRAHRGVDVADSPGTRVVAAGDGVVAAVGCDPTAILVLPHGGGWPTLDAHLQPLGVSGPRLRRSDCVRRGDPIGGLGTLGPSIGPLLF